MEQIKELLTTQLKLSRLDKSFVDEMIEKIHPKYTNKDDLKHLDATLERIAFISKIIDDYRANYIIDGSNTNKDVDAAYMVLDVLRTVMFNELSIGNTHYRNYTDATNIEDTIVNRFITYVSKSDIVFDEYRLYKALSNIDNDIDSVIDAIYNKVMVALFETTGVGLYNKLDTIRESLIMMSPSFTINSVMGSAKFIAKSIGVSDDNDYNELIECIQRAMKIDGKTIYTDWTQCLNNTALSVNIEGIDCEGDDTISRGSITTVMSKVDIDIFRNIVKVISDYNDEFECDSIAYVNGEKSTIEILAENDSNDRLVIGIDIRLYQDKPNHLYSPAYHVKENRDKLFNDKVANILKSIYDNISPTNLS